MNHVYVNGKIVNGDKPVLTADNRSYRYGDGLFETMKMINGKIVLEKLHFERLLNGLRQLKIKLPSLFKAKNVSADILELCKKNKCEGLARIRLSVFRGQGGLYDGNEDAGWLIECRAADESVNQINKKGLLIDLYSGMQKTCDAFSNLKSANFLPYTMAAQFAKEQKVDDCLVGNIKGQIADATIANIFLVKNKLVITPALTEGCVAGVMRRYLIDKLSKSAFEMREGVVTKNDLETFDEVFFTNAMYGMRWVGQFRDKNYANTQTSKIYKELVEPLYC